MDGQGVVTSIATMGIELFPREQRSLVCPDHQRVVGRGSLQHGAVCIRPTSALVARAAVHAVRRLASCRPATGLVSSGF